MIDAAFELFDTVGYEKTMIIDITKKANIAKATFYYYFPTKESILFAIVEQYLMQVADAIKTEFSQKSALDKLQFLMHEFFVPHSIDNIVINLEKDDHGELATKLWYKSQILLNPILRDILKQGVFEKTMSIVHIDEVISFFWNIFSVLLNSVHQKEEDDIFEKKRSITITLLEKLLGINEGVLIISRKCKKI
ncbi:TetR/AcrR family transcriptional regulator [Pectinatus haikarae]|uniref:AcrR family transcriptional regulator n=1 Tax=Pectinatus haikarae TaxID=349096 RepID=A0ABT9Y9I0_9FIRM|nr:TetR/AcrR family transcriptional regulator [Pectinatus haikarae]MDQ0204467.1 AcrR family transcriptional regulator [Pectinatus haikarae]